MKRQIPLAIALVIATVALGRVSFGADNSKLDARDTGFLKQAMAHDLFMTRLGDYAAQHAESESVRQLGKKLADEHRKDRDKIVQLSKQHGNDVVLKEELDPTQQTLYGRLTKENGINFDKDYTKLLVSEHEQQIHQYELERDHAHNQDIRDYAAKTAVTMKDHLNSVKDAEKKVWGV